MIDQPKRIGIVIDSLAGGGAERVVLTLAQAWLAQGHQPHLLVLQPPCDYQLPASLPVHFCFTEHDKQIDSVFKINASVRRFKCWLSSLTAQFGQFDLFISNLDKSNLLTTQAQVKPLFCVVHNAIEAELAREMKLGPLAFWNMWRAKRVLDQQHLITVSQGIADEICRGKRITPASMTTIYNPFDIDDIVATAAQPIDIPIEGDFIIHVGRVAKQKRHDILFQALAQAKHQLPLVLLCGNVNKASKLARRYGVADRVILPGFQANPYAWIKQAKLMVLSSDYEGLGNVLVESLICGTPVVSTDCPYGPNEILIGELSKFLVPCRDVKQLANKMDEALISYPEIPMSALIANKTHAHVSEQYMLAAATLMEEADAK